MGKYGIEVDFEVWATYLDPDGGVEREIELVVSDPYDLDELEAIELSSFSATVDGLDYPWVSLDWITSLARILEPFDVHESRAFIRYAREVLGGLHDPEVAYRAFRENFVGLYDDVRTFAEECLRELYPIPEPLERFIDYGYAAEELLRYDYLEVALDSGLVAIFHNA